MLHHPRNKAERRRIDKRKKKIDFEREEIVQARLAQEAEETKQAIRELRLLRDNDKQEDAS